LIAPPPSHARCATKALLPASKRAGDRAVC